MPLDDWAGRGRSHLPGRRIFAIELARAFDEISPLKDRLQDENIALREEVDQAPCASRSTPHINRGFGEERRYNIDSCNGSATQKVDGILER